MLPADAGQRDVALALPVRKPGWERVQTSGRSGPSSPRGQRDKGQATKCPEISVETRYPNASIILHPVAWSARERRRANIRVNLILLLTPAYSTILLQHPTHDRLPCG